MPNPGISTMDVDAVGRAFGKQAETYDEQDRANPILVEWRKQVYAHVDLFLTPNRSILELNAGTGIDALHFAQAGHSVHATDVSPGMLGKINQKINHHELQGRLTTQLCSFETLEDIRGKKFDYVFSNFGGLNCTEDLRSVTRHLSRLLNTGAFVTWVIMPRVSLWELRWIFQGRPKAAFRRFQKKGTEAHVEGEVFKTYYHSLRSVKKALGPDFRLMRVEGLGAFSPPPSGLNFIEHHPTLYALSRILDRIVRYRFPMNRWADHMIVTFQATR